MTFEEYLVKSAQHLTASQTDDPWGAQRAGQAYFNVLADVRPDLAEPIRGSLLDPFYKDDKLGAFLTAVGERW